MRAGIVLVLGLVPFGAALVACSSSSGEVHADTSGAASPGVFDGGADRAISPVVDAGADDASIDDGPAVPDGSTPYVWDLPADYPRPIVPADNPMTVEKVELGRRLFYDKRLSGNGTYACASCHEQARAFTDGRALAVGSTGQVHPRNSMPLANVAFASVLTWANPQLTTLERQTAVPLFGTEPVEMGLAGQDQALFARLGEVPLYPPMFRAAFPDKANPIDLQSIIQALTSFERTLISSHSAYDRWAYGHDPSTMSSAATRGYIFFQSETTECTHCHSGVNMDSTATFVGKPLVEITFRNTGLYNLDGRGAYPPDNTGLMAITDRPADMGRFRPQSLRNLAYTAPYMHDGSVATLDEALDHYAAGGRTVTSGPHQGDGSKSPLKDGLLRGFKLSDEQRADLKAFLQSLDDPTFVTDPRFSDPWASDAASP